jgi:hypothetical protein
MSRLDLQLKLLVTFFSVGFRANLAVIVYIARNGTRNGTFVRRLLISLALVERGYGNRRRPQNKKASKTAALELCDHMIKSVPHLRTCRDLAPDSMGGLPRNPWPTRTRLCHLSNRGESIELQRGTDAVGWNQRLGVALVGPVDADTARAHFKLSLPAAHNFSRQPACRSVRPHSSS